MKIQVNNGLKPEITPTQPLSSSYHILSSIVATLRKIPTNSGLFNKKTYIYVIYSIKFFHYSKEEILKYVFNMIRVGK